MEEIINAANELGLLIKKTDVYKQYREKLHSLQSDVNCSQLFEEYVDKTEKIREKERSGDIIEMFERTELDELNKKITGDRNIMAYLEAEQAYYKLLAEIQNELHDSETVDE